MVQFCSSTFFKLLFDGTGSKWEKGRKVAFFYGSGGKKVSVEWNGKI